MALRVAVTLGLPDRLLAAATAEQLGVELTQSPVALNLLLNHLTTLGIVERTPTGYRTTEYGANLCADAGNGLSNLLHLESAAGRAELALVELAHSIATGQAATRAATVRTSGPTPPKIRSCVRRSTGR